LAAVNDQGATSWRSIGEPDLPALAGLARECLSADGGPPFAADPGFLRGRYLDGARARGGWQGPQLVCASAVRPSGDGPDAATVTTGLVHPQFRRRGLGGSAFDWAAGQAKQAGPAGLTADTEALSDGAHALYLARGLSQVFAEDVMQLAATATPPPPASPPAGLVLSSWDQAGPARFFAVYEASFRDRPGYPGWSQDRWVDWVSDDDDFRAAWALLATVDGTDAGFIVADAGGWIIQVGVIPTVRGRDIGAALVAEAVRLMRAGGQTVITLNVNVDNPHAAALYRRLGFAQAGRRARYAVVA
jgi:ribosomal protein S18 acetylase RimI-like enzyme